jgi:hypothetical protein
MRSGIVVAVGKPQQSETHNFLGVSMRERGVSCSNMQFRPGG